MYARAVVIRAVIIEDDAVASLALRDLLEHEGLEVQSFSNTDEAYEFCCHVPPHVLISDWCVPGRISPAALVKELKKISNSMKVLFISGFSTRDLEEEVGDLAGVEYLSKPINFEQLLFDIKKTPNDLRLGVE
jgi:DNA-binding NtrC family response regulator